MTWVVLNATEVRAALYVTYVSDGCESAFIFKCKMHVMLMAHRLYMKPQMCIFLSNDIYVNHIHNENSSFCFCSEDLMSYTHCAAVLLCS